MKFSACTHFQPCIKTVNSLTFVLIPKIYYNHYWSMTRYVKRKTHHSHLKTATILKWRDCEIVTSCVYIHTCTHKQRLSCVPEYRKTWTQHVWACVPKLQVQYCSWEVRIWTGHLLSPLLLQFKSRWSQCTCKIYLAELRVLICNTFTSICPRNDFRAVHKVVFNLLNPSGFFPYHQV